MEQSYFPFILAPTKALFERHLNEGTFDETSLVFIQETKEIWTRGVTFPCPYTKDELDNLLQELADEDATINDVVEAISGRVETLENDKVDKVTGKSLVSDSEITKLAGLPNNDALVESIGLAKAAGDNAQSDLTAHKNNTSNPHQVTKSQVGLGNVTDDAQVKRSEMGVAGGVATLDTTGKVPAAQLPSYVDDVLEYESLSNFPATGEDGKIYVTKDTNLTYRWSGSTYVEISQSLALGETSTTAYAGNKGKANADAIAAIKSTQLSHIADTNTFTTQADKVILNYTCFEGSQYGATGTSHTANIPAASTSAAGVMTAADKTALDNLSDWYEGE